MRLGKDSRRKEKTTNMKEQKVQLELIKGNKIIYSSTEVKREEPWKETAYEYFKTTVKPKEKPKEYHNEKTVYILARIDQENGLMLSYTEDGMQEVKFQNSQIKSVETAIEISKEKPIFLKPVNRIAKRYSMNSYPKQLFVW